ncbi:MAG: DUF1249 domain-containing protein, partial [Gammaproteobacteria bacterium]
ICYVACTRVRIKSMQISSWYPLRLAFQRRRFANLMELYEQNYQRLARLAPDLAHLPRDNIAGAQGKPELHLIVEERHRFTTDLRLTHYFSDCPVEGQSPDLRIRLYHDTRQAEMRWRESRALPALGTDDAPRGDLERRWMANLFLDRWLGFCLSEGYRFRSQPNHPQAKALATS